MRGFFCFDCFRSTKTRDRKQALEICRAWHKAERLARNGKLSVDAAREVIAQGVSDVFTAANVESLPSASIKLWCETWLQAKADSRETRIGLSSAARKAAETFGKMPGERVIDKAQQLRHVTASSNQLHGWDEQKFGPDFTLNVLNLGSCGIEVREKD